MVLTLEKSVEDVRGRIFFFTQENKRFHVVEIKKGFSRGGHYHNFSQTHIIISGKIEYREKNIITGKESSTILEPSSSVIIQSKTAHLFTALEDSIFVETFENDYEATEYPEFRKIVEEKMKP